MDSSILFKRRWQLIKVNTIGRLWIDNRDKHLQKAGLTQCRHIQNSSFEVLQRHIR